MDDVRSIPCRGVLRSSTNSCFSCGDSGWVLGGNGTKFGGSIMVLKHRGRISGQRRLTPLNYSVVDNDIYCTAAFGQKADWYRNLLADPEVEVWLPDGRWSGRAEDVNAAEDSEGFLRKVLIASGFAGPLFGANPRKMSDEELAALLETYRLVRIRRQEAVAGPGSPGDLAWVWPLSTFFLLWALLRLRGRRRSLAGREAAA